MLRTNILVVVALMFVSMGSIVIPTTVLSSRSVQHDTEKYVEHMQNVTSLNVFVSNEEGVAYCAE